MEVPHRAIVLLLALAAFAFAAPPAKVIFDTDMSLDVDDVGALALLHALADRGEAEILAVAVSESSQFYDGKWAPLMASIVNSYYGRPDIPIGIYKGPHQDIGRQGHYPEKVVNMGFARKLRSADEAEEGYKLYRRVLAAQPDRSVVVVTVGYVTNLEALLKSGPDEHSPLDGMALVRRKVKLWSCMGGEYPTTGEGGEFNVGHYPKQSEFVVNHWPGRVVYTGAELGKQYFCGGTLTKKYKVELNPVAAAWQHYNGGRPREAWDELATLYAVRGAVHEGVRYFGVVEKGSNTYRRLGRFWGTSTLEKSMNEWVDKPDKDQAYLTHWMPSAEMQAFLDELIAAPPRLAQGR
jgi:inosine-uridine nucleoside N-ribohydrolase